MNGREMMNQMQMRLALLEKENADLRAKLEQVQADVSEIFEAKAAVAEVQAP